MFSKAEAKKEAFIKLSEIENVRILGEAEKKKNNFSESSEIWEVDTEILANETFITIIFHISFDTEFPLDIPKVYLASKTFNEIKHIPHIDSNNLICTYDTEVIVTDTTNPFGIVSSCIKRAKEIIRDGINKTNVSDFEDEFIAYWEDKYGKEKTKPKDVLSIVSSSYDKLNLRIICLHRRISLYDYVLHSGDEYSERFIEYLDELKIEFNEVDVFHLNHSKFYAPPFSIRNIDVINWVEDEDCSLQKKFKRFINSSTYPKPVICSKEINGNIYFFGWFHSQITQNHNGFRKGTLTNFQRMKMFQPRDLVQRFSTNNLSIDRLIARTEGGDSTKEDKVFLFAGVGSVGSNLIFLLNSFGIPEIRMVDNDYLKLENIGRHLLGFNSIGLSKVYAMRRQLINLNPLQKISIKSNSIMNVANTNIKYLNESDYIFLATGKTNIDLSICEYQRAGKLIRPIFILWVEPYLAGGHLIYLHPSDSNIQTFFTNGAFNFNVINKKEYQKNNSLLFLREAGCQTTFVPYSNSNLLAYLAAMLPIITDIIRRDESSSVSYTWLGDKNKIIDIGLEISKMYLNKSEGELIRHWI